MNTIKLQQRGLLTLPKKIRDSLGISEGQVLQINEEGGKIILTPQVTNSLSAELANDIRQGLEDIKKGNFIEFKTVAEMHDKMSRYEN